MKPSEILSEEIKSRSNTDIEILKAWYATAKRMIDANCSKQDAQSFMRAFRAVWGQNKAIDLLGDFIDANILIK